MYTVTVLTPRGRRQQVKVTPNTTLLQILEEVCTKNGFNALDYDLRHHNKILDLSAMFRFTTLPNNAQLEMAEAVRQRIESPVTLGVHFETGERLTGDFSPSETIWNVIISLKPEELLSNNLVVVYMRQEIYGFDNLKKTTLRSLGLTSGRAMVRVIHKDYEELHNQPNVSSVLSPQVLEEEKMKESSPESHKKGIQGEKSKIYSNEPSSKKIQSPEPIRKEIIKSKGNIFDNILRDERTRKALQESKSTGEGKNTPTSSKGRIEESPPKNVPEMTHSTEPSFGRKMSITDDSPEEESRVILLGDRNALAYSLNSVKPVEFEEEPDDFYELTVYDAQILMKQAKQLCVDLQDAPLMTAAQRELEKDKKVLSMLRQYKKTVLRVKFPDRIVLQGTFSPLETVSAVEKFVSMYLETPKLQFYLYTTPPKVILKSDTRLIECGCVPSCVLYFGVPPGVPSPAQYLKTEVLEKLSTPSAAALHAYQTRRMDKKIENEAGTHSDSSKWSKDSSEAGPSGSQDWQNNTKDHESGLFQIPKWFRSKK